MTMTKIRFPRICAALAAIAAAALTIGVYGPANASVTAGKTATYRVYIAENQDLEGKALYRPTCLPRYSCWLSGDATAYLSDTTWSSWTTSAATGKGTLGLNDCTPSCAAGHFVLVPVDLRFSKPVRSCVSKPPRWYWTRVSFRYLKPLPKSVQGPTTWNFTALASWAEQSCR
jgi:hypothetical protein